MMNKVLCGIVSYKDLELLKKILPDLLKLGDFYELEVVILDNANDADLQAWAESLPDTVHCICHPKGNVGYGAGYNFILDQFGAKTKADFFWLVTSDVWPDVEGTKNLIEAMVADEDLAAASAKLHHWNLATNERTSVIDTLGIRGQKRHHFYDFAHGELDHGQYDHELERVFGSSGAMQMFRMSAIHKLFPGEFKLFDEDIFMYKEDIDLAYRWRWLGAGVRVFPWVWGWHGRTTTKIKKSARVQEWSYANHFRLLKHQWSWEFGLGVFAQVLLYELLKAGYLLLRQPKAFFVGLHVLFFASAKQSARVVPAKKILTFLD